MTNSNFSPYPQAYYNKYNNLNNNKMSSSNNVNNQGGLLTKKYEACFGQFYFALRLVN